MPKRKKKRRTNLLGAAIALPLGATVVGALPETAAGTHVLGGMSKLSTFATPAATLIGTGVTIGLAGKAVMATERLSGRRKKKKKKK